MRFATTQERANILQKLAEYFAGQPDGEELSWMRVEADLGIKMDVDGRSMARRALHGRPYECVRGHGIRLSCGDTALKIARTKLVRIDGAVRSADRTQQELQARHLDQMPAAQQQRLLMLASFFGAIRSVSRSATAKVFLPKHGDRE